MFKRAKKHMMLLLMHAEKLRKLKNTKNKSAYASSLTMEKPLIMSIMLSSEMGLEKWKSHVLMQNLYTQVRSGSHDIDRKW